MLVYPEKPVAEIVWATMDFAARMKGRTPSGVITMNMVPFSSPRGFVDPNPGNMILTPPFIFNSTIVAQKVLAGVVGINYALEFLLWYTDGTNSSEEGLVRVVQFRS